MIGRVLRARPFASWWRPSVHRQTVAEYFARGNPGRFETVHAEAIAAYPLPCNVVSRDELPADRGWWGYSLHDVPTRTNSETFIATFPDCRITWYRDSRRGGDFYPAILTADGRAVDMRELRFRPPHAETLRRSAAAPRIERATWITERVYHNHSHWLTAHLPKLLLLRQRNALADVLLPPERTAMIDDSMRAVGLDPRAFATFDPSPPLHVRELTILGTDRFRPELLRLVPEACSIAAAGAPSRRVFISRAKAARRRLANEDAVWAILEPAGFERVHMEDLPFAEQVALMRQTRVLAAPHGAGLTNMMFCPAGTHVVEIADLTFPNPNFYALASAMGHRYWLAPGEGLGDTRPLDKDLHADVEALGRILERLPG